MAYEIRQVGFGWATDLPTMDFETYSEAGYEFDPATRKWVPLQANERNGLEIVGAPCYAEHPSTEILSLSYDLKDGRGDRIWLPTDREPFDLLDHIRAGGLIEAWYNTFEYEIWLRICFAKMGWPQLTLDQMRDAMAKARAFGLPGKLENAAAALHTPLQKIKDGKRLLTKFSKPRNPTKTDPRTRIRPEEDQLDAARLYAYNIGDIRAESSVTMHCPDLTPTELEIWKVDQRINSRGVYIDQEAAANFQEIVRQALARGTVEIADLTGGKVTKPTQVEALKKWVKSHGVHVDALDKDVVAALLDRGDLPAHVRKVLEVREALGSASVKKLIALARTVSSDGRLRDLFAYCGAERTGRWAGHGVQPHNLPKHGPDMYRCSCGRHYGLHLPACPWCRLLASTAKKGEWTLGCAEDAILVATSRDLDVFEAYFGNALAVISGCLRALFCAAPGMELICSDFRAIEAVGLAALAGEEWRLEVFRTHGKIYEMSASKITGVPFEEFIRHKKETKEHHPFRNSIGKTAELASGYAGAVGAWRKFGADKYFNNDQEILDAVMAWRRESPNIVAFWKMLERAALAAIRSPGTIYQARAIAYCCKGGVLYCRLPSGRLLAYHSPMIVPGKTPFGKPVDNVTYMGWNSDSTKGAKAWLRIRSHRGKLTENVVQAACRDILAPALLKLETARYPVVLHVHDEVASEVPCGYGSVEEYERIMGDLPTWCRDWPVIAANGWRGQRYRKD